MNIEFLADFMIPVIVGICLIFGFIVKKWVKDIDNKWIPTLCCVLGIVLAIVNDWGTISLTTFLCGAVSGLASTGLHQAVAQLIDGKNNK